MSPTATVTDVDDKIVNRARELMRPLRCRSASASSAKRTRDRLRPPDVERVSTHIEAIVTFVQKLVEAGAAYPARRARAPTSTSASRAFEACGALAELDDLQVGARVEANETKEDPLDFALWKGSDDETFGWDSPWGKGRPGWHIECSAMAHAHLGEHFDIHAGGMDLVFPHHENEIAQSEALFGAEMAHTWLHGGFLNVDKEKMSKSLGNFVTIRDVLARNDAEGFRYFLLGTHYRGPLSFDLDKREDGRVVFPGVDEAERRVDYLYATRDALAAVSNGEPASSDSNVLQGQAKVIDDAEERVLEALDNDLNTPQALGVLADLAKAANEVVTQVARLKKDAVAEKAARRLAGKAALVLTRATAPLGLLRVPSEEYWARTKARRLAAKGLRELEIEAKVRARADARANKDFAKADALRKELTALGVDVLDGEAGSTWRIGV